MFADDMGSDAYGETAIECVEIAKKLANELKGVPDA